MSSLLEKIKSDLTAAQKERDELLVSTLRYFLSAVKDREIELRPQGREIDDVEVVSLIEKQIKQRKESIAEFEKAQRQDLVEKETKEMGILSAYMPAQMSEEEVQKLVDEAIFQSGAKAQSDMGKVMALLMPQTKGKADGAMVSRMVKEKLVG